MKYKKGIEFLRSLLVLSMIVQLVIGCKNEENLVPEPGPLIKYEVDDSLVVIRNSFTVQYNDNSIRMISHKIDLYIEDPYLDSIPLSQASFSKLTFGLYDYKTFYTNFSHDTTGYIKIDHFDEERSRISGRFAFTAKESSYRNDSIEVINGSFQNVRIIRKDEKYSDGRISSLENDNPLKYTRIFVTDKREYLSIFIMHQTRSEVSLIIPKTINTGANKITESNIGNKEKIVFWYKEHLNGILHYIPAQNCKLEITKLDFEQKTLKGNLTGTFLNGLGGEVDINQFEMDLNWN